MTRYFSTLVDARMPEHILLLLITGCFMLQPISTDLYLASLPHLVTEFQVTPAVVAQTLSLFTIGFGIAQLISGPLSDRFGRRPILLGGLGIYIVASIACALSPGIYLLIAARFLQAVGCCTGLVVCRAVIRDSYSPAEGAQRIARVSNHMGFFGAFSIFGALVVANWTGITLDGTLWPLAKICFVMSLLLFISVRLSARYSRIA